VIRLPFLLLAAVVVVGCSPKSPAPADKAAAPAAAKEAPITAPAGDYLLDPDHTSVNFRVSHLGFSNYTARFTGLEGKLHFDPANPAAQSVEATIAADSIQTNYVGPPKVDFDSQVEKEFLHAAQNPKITFRSTRIDLTGPRKANVTGDLTLNGVTKPVTLAVTFNGGWGPQPMDRNRARIGFSAHGTLKRSDFGIAFGLPAPGTNLGVGDEVEVVIETEFATPPAA
jgi:polyisoprenoid-binding protein YceI